MRFAIHGGLAMIGEHEPGLVELKLDLRNFDECVNIDEAEFSIDDLLDVS